MPPVIDSEMSAARALAAKFVKGFNPKAPASYSSLCEQLGKNPSVQDLMRSSRDSSDPARSEVLTQELEILARARGMTTPSAVRTAVKNLRAVLAQMPAPAPGKAPPAKPPTSTAPKTPVTPPKVPAVGSRPLPPERPPGGSSATEASAHALHQSLQPVASPSPVKSPPTVPVHATAVFRYQQQRRDALHSSLSMSTWTRALDAWKALGEQQAHWTQHPFRVESVEALNEAVYALVDRVTALVEISPHPQVLRAREDNVVRIAQLLRLSETERIPGELIELFNTDSELNELVVEAQRFSRIEAAELPSWIWPRALERVTHNSRARSLLALIAEPDVRDELLRCADWLDTQSKDVRGLIRSLPDTANTPGTWLERLQRAVKARVRDAELESRLRARLDALRPLVSEALFTAWTAHPGSAQTLAQVERAEAASRRVTALEPRLHPNALSELKHALSAMPPQAEEVLADIEKAAGQYPSAVIGNLVSLEAIRQLAGLTTVERREQAPALSQVRIKDLRHPLSRQSGRTAATYAAELCWQPPGAGEPYGRVSLPVRVTLDQLAPRSLKADLSVEMEGTPGAWLRELSHQEVTVPQGVEEYDLEVVIPVTPARAEQIAASQATLTVTFHLNSSELLSPFAREGKKLSWQGLKISPVNFESPFHDNIPIEVMEKRPLGVEDRFRDLLRDVEAGNRSFFVCGPRRYGKTTLLKALRERAQSYQDILVLPLVIATEYQDVASIWKEVADQLAERFKRPVKTELEDGILPTADAFDQVREEAARGEPGRPPIRSIYIVIDEAQALFSLAAARTENPHLLGERLKARLELSWGVGDGKRAAIKLGLVGQLHMRKMMGANLLAAIPSAFEASSLNEEDLIPLLRSFSAGGLQSSADARSRLAVLSGNLFILNRLLQAVLSICSKAQRTWFIERDVEQAAKQLVSNYRDGAQDVWTYVRDVLNESEDLNNWRPSDTYPVALAWAKALGSSQGSRLDSTLTTLRQWAGEVTIAAARVEQCIQTLRDTQVLRDDDSFQLPMLQRFLEVRAARLQPMNEAREREALNRLGLARIERPKALVSGEERIFEGGQAHVYPATDQGRNVAVRCVRLDDAQAQHRFQNEVHLLQRLLNLPRQEHHQELNSLPSVVRVGIDAADPYLGVVVYEWIRGEALARNSLSELATLCVGLRLVKVLQVLEGLQVVHRDIKPENVLIRMEDREPVLIDFGLVRAVPKLLERQTTFVGSPDFVPPEILAGRPWTPRADLYALGKTLQMCLLQSVPAARLRQLLTRMTADRPEDRPTLAEVAQLFAQEENQVQLTVRKNGMLMQVQNLGVSFPNARYTKLLEQAQGDIWACRQGLINRTEAKLATLSQFLVNVFESYLADKHRAAFPYSAGEHMSLSTVSRHPHKEQLPEAVRPFVCEHAQVVSVLRNANAHGARFDDILRQSYQVLWRVRGNAPKIDNPELLRQSVEHVAVLLQGTVGMSGLQALMRFWLSSAQVEN